MVDIVAYFSTMLQNRILLFNKTFCHHEGQAKLQHNSVRKDH